MEANASSEKKSELTTGITKTIMPLLGNDLSIKSTSQAQKKQK
jgi:hypothetical protein